MEEMKMICPNCGKQTPTQTSYCINCNYKINEETPDNIPVIPKTLWKDIVWVVIMLLGFIFSLIACIKGDISKFVFIIDAMIFVLLSLYPVYKIIKKKNE